jgi:hypothetical protein
MSLGFAKAALATIVELLRHPERAVCKAIGHDWSWSTGALACRECRWAPVAATDCILDTLDSLEGACFIADELKKR